MNDDLLRPTVATGSTLPGPPPWRLESIVYPAFFGGALAATALGLVNGRRLGVRTPALVAVAVTGVLALVARVVATALIVSGSGARFLGSLAGMAVWGVIYATQKRAYRSSLQRGEEPASLVKAGFAAVLGLGLIEALIVFAIAR
jgi:hypothetical protein